MTQDIGNFALIKNETLRKVVMYMSEDCNKSFKASVDISKCCKSGWGILFAAFSWNKTEQGFEFWNNIHDRLEQDPATELTEHELKTLQPIIDKINGTDTKI